MVVSFEVTIRAIRILFSGNIVLKIIISVYLKYGELRIFIHCYSMLITYNITLEQSYFDDVCYCHIIHKLPIYGIIFSCVFLLVSGKFS